MSIIVYKKGDSATIRGVKCDFMLIEPALFSGKAPNGWSLSLNDINTEAKETIEEPTEEQKTVDVESLTNDEVRHFAKLNKLDNYDKARIKTLKGKLTECQEQATLKAS